MIKGAFGLWEWNGMDFMEGFQIPTLTTGFQNPSDMGFQNPPIPNPMAYQTRDWNGFEIQILPIPIHSRKPNALLIVYTSK